MSDLLFLPFPPYLCYHYDMRLEEALAVNRGDIVSFVGAGGKTTAIYRLAHEMVSLGWRVVTTTMIRPPTPQQSEETILEGDPTLVPCSL